MINIKQSQNGESMLFDMKYQFFDESGDTEISMFVHGINILAYEKNGKILTTRWNLDELTVWLRNFLNQLTEDPYPIDCAGEFAAQKDDTARNFDSDDDALFDEYYDKIDAWNINHRWHVASHGAILADVYFQLVGDFVEISWDNRNVARNVKFLSESGGVRIPKNIFCTVIESFLNAYADHWFGD